MSKMNGFQILYFCLVVYHKKSVLIPPLFSKHGLAVEKQQKIYSFQCTVLTFTPTFTSEMDDPLFQVEVQFW